MKRGWRQRIAIMPKWLVLGIMAAAVLTDAAILTVGLKFFHVPPPSILRTTQSEVAAHVWAAMLIVGSLAALIGNMTFQVRLQIFGLCLSAGGMFVWALAVFTQPHPAPTPTGFAFAFIALFWALGWRILGLFAGTFIRREM